jgi:hypothetical protein
MKKLLALILCVMMFVSIVPTAAFAAYDHEDQRVWRGASQSKDIVDALKSNVEIMYGAIAADNAVYKSVKTLDDVMMDLVDEMMKSYAPSANGTSQVGSVISDAVKAGLRATIGGEISDYLDKHKNDYYDYNSRGQKVLNPSKYAGVFAAAASNAISSEKAVAGIQGYMYYILQRSTYEKVADQLQELMTDVNGWGHWGDYGFDDLANWQNRVAMHMPGTDIDFRVNNIDGTMHGVNAIYREYLTTDGMLGADLDSDRVWNTGVTGSANDILRGIVPTIGSSTTTGLPTSGSENAETPIWVDTDADGLPNAVAAPWNNNN